MVEALYLVYCCNDGYVEPLTWNTNPWNQWNDGTAPATFSLFPHLTGRIGSGDKPDAGGPDQRLLPVR